MPFFIFGTQHMHRSYILACSFLLVLALGCASTPQIEEADGSEPSIRVCVAERNRELTLGITEGSVLETAGARYSLDGHRELVCRQREDGAMDIVIDGTPARTLRGAFRCMSRSGEGQFIFEERTYRDTLLIASDGEGLYLVNILSLEDYLLGVVPNEIGRNRKQNEMAAVKAQAVLARSYALRKIQLPLTRLFDVYADTRDQLFTGQGEDAGLSALAVRETRGLVLASGGQPAECYYHSTCGGHTEASSLVWTRPQTQPWLTGIDDHGAGGDYCRIAPSYRWTEEYGREELEQMIRTFLPAANDAIRPEDIPSEQWYLLDLNIIKRMPSGRVAVMQVVMGNRGRQRAYYVRGEGIRRLLRRGDGDQPLRSTLFDISIRRDANRWIRYVRVDGGGSGHGVGMCQWGAIGRARAGQPFHEILLSYFPGTQLLRSY